MSRLCSVEGCTKPSNCRTYCRMHYARWQKYGHTDGGPTTHAPPEVKFWRYVDKRGPADCWVWTGKRYRNGYGCFSIGATTKVSAHRFSFEMHHNGFLPPVVMHTCDNPPCVNPAHLRAGTMKANYDDMVAKGRRVTEHVPRGPAHHKTHLTEDDVRAIRARPKDKIKDLAAEYGVGRTAIEKIRYRVHWKHID